MISDSILNTLRQLQMFLEGFGEATQAYSITEQRLEEGILLAHKLKTRAAMASVAHVQQYAAQIEQLLNAMAMQSQVAIQGMIFEAEYPRIYNAFCQASEAYHKAQDQRKPEGTLVNLVHDLYDLQRDEEMDEPELLSPLLTFSSRRAKVTLSEKASLAQLGRSFMPWVVQAASENGKHISAQFSLPQTLMVRDEIMDSLQTILIHLFRNAVFHGIEAPEDRVQRGKSETGVIRLSADVEGDHVILTLEDDGRGLSSRNPVKTPDLFSLESEPSDRVTENAALETSIYATTNVQTGLGIGLHIVQSKMSQLSGSIEINAQENQGTAVVLRLPRCHFLHLDEAMGA